MSVRHAIWPLATRYLLVSCAFAGAIFSFVLARSVWLFEQDTAASVPAAVALTPFNGAYLGRLAAWRPNEKVALLRHAVELNPFDSESWIQLGFVSEFQHHDERAAERYFLKAAEVNKMFLPKWTLTNFYFRHNRTDQFFRWATATLAVTPYSPEPVFLQMWLVSQDAARIAKAIPDRPRTLLPYAWFLSNSRQNVTIGPIVSRLIQQVGNRNPRAWGRDDLLAVIEDRLAAQGERDAALGIWSNLVKSGWLAEDIPTRERPVTNGAFRTPFFRHGFDWLPMNVEGVRWDQLASDGQLRFQLSGDQPEQAVLLQQYLPLEGGRIYEFSWTADFRLAGEPCGLQWRLRSAGQAAEEGVLSQQLDASPAKPWRVPAPPRAAIGVLTLEYRRPLGHTKARGTVLLRSVSAQATDGQ